MSQVQMHCFARCHINAARRINGFPIGNRLRDFHGHTFRISALAPMTPSGPEGLASALASHLQPLDFAYLPDRIDRPTDERLALWVRNRFEDASNDMSIGTRSAPDWTTIVESAGTTRVCHSFEFDASHWLPGVPENHQCARLHGHHFRTTISVDANLSSTQSMAIYDLIESTWNPLVKELQGNCLNELPGLENPTSEMLARWIFDRLADQIEGLAHINVCETKSAGCEYDGEKFSIWKDQRFESAIPNPHATTPTAVTGRGYLLRLFLQSPLEETEGWVHDFGDVRRAFAPYLEQLDHQYLEQFKPGSGDSCLELGQWLMAELPKNLEKLCRIDLFESQQSGITLSQANCPPRLAWPLA